MIKPPRIAPSILAADFARLGDEVKGIESVVDMLHIDVMDGHFVPNISLGIPVIQSLRAVTDLPFDCHLMTTNPDLYLEPLREAGATGVTVHLEVFPDPTDVARKARECGLEFGVVVNPASPYEAMDPFLEPVPTWCSSCPSFRALEDNPSCQRSCTRSSEHEKWLIPAAWTSI